MKLVLPKQDKARSDRIIGLSHKWSSINYVTLFRPLSAPPPRGVTVRNLWSTPPHRYVTVTSQEVLECNTFFGV